MSILNNGRVTKIGPKIPEISDAASELAYLADEAITMAVDAERERCIKIVQANIKAVAERRRLVALLREQ